MPALPDVPNVVRIQWRWTSSADTDVLCRAYYLYSGTAPTSAQMATFAQTAYTAMTTDLKAYWHPDVLLTECIATDLSGASAGTGSYTSSTAGTLTGTELPAGAAALINLTVGRRYRGGKPRMYLPLGSSAEMATTQTWSTGFVTNTTTDFGDLLPALQAAPWSGGTIVSQVNVSYYEGFTAFETPSGRYKNISKLRTGGPVIDTILSAATNTRIASQRRRNRP